MSYLRSFEKVAEISALAQKLMAKHGVAPHPDNFTLWYQFCSGDMPELKRRMQGLLASGQAFTEELNRELHDAFFSLDRQGSAMDGATSIAKAELTHILEQLELAGHGAAEYGRTLEDLSGKLATDGGRDAFKAVVDGALEATREMEQKNKSLEEKFNASSAEISRLREDLETLRQEAQTDGLTGLANRKQFDKELRRLAQDATREEADMSLLILDIDHFKRFNDLYGHQIGDQVLKLLARTLTDSIKGQDVAARYGGEEFCIILPDTGLAGAVKFAEIIRAKVSKKQITNRATDETLGRVRISIGVAGYRDGEDLSHLVRRADEALYMAKRTGRDRVVSETMIDSDVLSFGQ